MRNESVKILILYAEVTGYVMAMLRSLMQSNPNIKIDLVFWDKKYINSTRYQIEENFAISFHPRTSLSNKTLRKLLFSCQPDLIYVSGWMDKGYLAALKYYRKRASVHPQVVCGVDGQWQSSLRQYCGQLYFRLFYAKIFDFMWVSGKPQYHYAQRFGYSQERILCNLLSADDTVFNKKAVFSKRFVFVGRFVSVKGLDQLIDAYLSLPKDIQNQWPLFLIGDGELSKCIHEKKNNSIFIKSFLQPNELIQELMKGGVGCITSYHEPWGVAIHEMARLGFPLVLSSACGAATEFLITGYNGFLHKSNNVNSLRDALLKITRLNDEELELFSKRSHELGGRINSERAAYSLLSAIQISQI